VILSLGALRRGFSHRGNDSNGGVRRGGYGVDVSILFAVAPFGGILKTWTILNRVIRISTIHAEFVGDAAFSFFLE